MKKKLFAGKETMAEEMAEAKAIKSGKISPKQYAQREQKEHGKTRFASGGIVRGGGAAVRGLRFGGEK